MSNNEVLAKMMQNEIVKANYLEMVQNIMDVSFGAGTGANGCEAIAKNMRIVGNRVYIEAELSFPVPNATQTHGA